MRASEIKTFASSRWLRGVFRGCFSMNQLPTNIQTPCCFLVNLSMSNERGSHWIAVVSLKPNKVEVFDCLNLKLPDIFKNWLSENFTTVNRQNIKIAKSSTRICAKWCLVYCVIRLNLTNLSHRSVIASFTDDKIMISDLFDSLFPAGD